MKNKSNFFAKFGAILVFFICSFFYERAFSQLYIPFSYWSPKNLFGNPIPNTSGLCTNGTVNTAMSGSFNRVVFGGTFTRMGQCSNGAAINTTTTIQDAVVPRIFGGTAPRVDVVIPDGAGGWYIGGLFTSVGGVARTNLVRITSTGAVDALFCNSTATNGAVSTLLLSGATLYVGGAFTNICGTGRNYLAAISATSGGAFAWNPSPNSTVTDLALNGSNVYVAGTFTSIGSQNRNRLAAIDTTSGSATGLSLGLNNTVRSIDIDGGILYIGGDFTNSGTASSGVPLDATTGYQMTNAPTINGTVNAVVVDGAGGWYIGGSFTSINGVARNRLARLNSDFSLDLTYNPNVSGGGNVVNALALSGTTLYVGGNFSTIAGATRTHLAQLNITGAATAWNPNLGNTVSALSIQGTTLYVGGAFTNVLASTSTPLARSNFAAYDTTTGNLSNLNIGFNSSVNAITSEPGAVYVGGAFTNTGGVSSYGVTLDTVSGLQNLTTPVVNNTVWASIPDGAGGYYIGGDFTDVNGVARNRIARILADGSVDLSFNPNAQSRVSALALSGGILYMGGNFIQVSGTTRNALAAVDATTGALTAWNPNVNGQVNAIEMNGTTMYIGGSFTTVGGLNRVRLAEINLTTGLPTALRVDIDNTVFALKSTATDLFVGGQFSNAGNTSAGAVISTTTGLQVTPFAVVPAGTNVQAAIPDGAGGWYIGGSFTSVGDLTRNRLARILADGSVDATFNPNVDGQVNALALSGGNLYFGGSFNNVSSTSRPKLAAVNATTGVLQAWNPNSNSDVYALELNGANLYVGGAFTTIGGLNRLRFAEVSLATGAPTTLRVDADGAVNAFTSDANDLFIGGAFTSMGNLGGGAVLNTTTGQQLTPFSPVNSQVFVSIPDGAGGWYIGGSFSTVGDLSRTNIAKINADGIVDATFYPPGGANSTVRSLALSAGVLYVGGDFTMIGGNFRNRLAAVNATTGAVVAGWDPNLAGVGTPTVNAMAVGASSLYIGGNFNSVSGQSFSHFAEISLATGLPQSLTFGLNNQVQALLLSGSTLYIGGNFTGTSTINVTRGALIDKTTANKAPPFPNVSGGGGLILASVPDGSGGYYIGGSFTTVGGSARNNLARILSDGTVDSGFNPNPNSTIRALALSGGNLYLGGDFTLLGATARNRIAAVDASSGAVQAWNPNSDGQVSTLLVSGSLIYVGGVFDNIGGLARNDLAAISVSTGSADTWNANITGAGTSVRSLAISGTTLYVGGVFANIGGQARNHLAAVSTTTGLASSTWNPGITGTSVEALQMNGTSLIVGGVFTNICSGARTNLASVTTTAATCSLNAGFSSNTNGIVRAVLVDGTTLYVGGDFTTIVSSSRNRVASVNASTGAVLSWDPNADGSVYTFSSLTGSVYVGGGFSDIGIRLRNYLASFDTSTKAITSTWDPNANGVVRALALSGTSLYVGGDFTQLNSPVVARNYIALVNATTGVVDATWNPNANGFVRAVLVDGTTLYVGGDFTTIGGSSRNRVASVNAASTGAVLSWDPNADGSVYTFSSLTGSVYVGGGFSDIGIRTRNRLASFNTSTKAITSTWNPNANGIVRALALSGTSLYVGGDFTQLNSPVVARNYIALVNATTGVVDATWNPNANNAVYALSITGTTLYTGGIFNNIGGQARDRIAALNSTGTGTATTWNANTATSGVYTLTSSASSIYAGGAFTYAGLNDRRYIARLQKSTGNLSVWSAGSTSTLTPNNIVRALLLDGTTLFAGGDFTSVNNPATTRNRLASFSTATNSNNVTAFNPNMNNSVYSFGSGGGILYVGGVFTAVSATTRSRAAAFNIASGALQAWDPNADVNSVNTISVQGTNAYLGGTFNNVGRFTRTGLVKLNKASGNLDIYNARLDSWVRALEVSGTTLYAGGDFTFADGAGRNYLAALSTTTATNAPTFNLGTGFSNLIRTLNLNGTTLYAGGDFIWYQGSTRNRAAALNATNGNMIAAWNPNANASVYTLSSSGGSVFAGGIFSFIGGSANRNYLAKLDLGSNSVSSWNPNITAGTSVSALAVSGTTLYAGGTFTSVSGTTRNHLAALSTSTAVLDPSFLPTTGLNAGLNSLALDGTTLYLGGTFTTFGGQNRSRIAAINTSTNAVLAWDPNANAQVSALTVSGTTVFAGGAFSLIGHPFTRNRLAAIDLATNSLTSWNPNVNNQVNVVETDASVTAVAIGGNFTSVSGTTRLYLAGVNKSDGLPTDFNPSPDNWVSSLLFDSGKVYVGGNFNNIAGQPRTKMAAFDTTTGTLTSFDPQIVGNNVNTFAASGSRIFIGGDLSLIGYSRTRNYLAAIDSSTGNLTDWDPSPDGQVNAIARFGTNAVIGGNFLNVSGTPRTRLAMIKHTGELEEWVPTADNTVRAIAVKSDGSSIYIGGDFSNVNGASILNLAELDTVSGTTTAWSPTINGQVYSLVTTPAGVYVGGSFSTVNGTTRNRIAQIDGAGNLVAGFNPNVTGIIVSSMFFDTSSSILYFSGNFTSVTSTGRINLASINTTTNTLTTWNPNANAYVDEVSVRDSDIYACGNYTNILATSRPYISRMTSANVLNGTFLPAPAGPTNQCTAILNHNSTQVFVGGNFNRIGGSANPAPKSGWAIIDATSGLLIW